MESLFELIKAKHANFDKKSIDLDDYTVELERATGQGRIDILIHSENRKEAIIIEAKVYHILVNDLQDYWQAIPYSDDQKVGVVLGLYQHSAEEIGHPEFISITHSEWLKKAVQKGLSHQIPVKDYIYFKDFVNNMNYLTQSNEMTEEVKFYLSNAEKINKALETKNAALKFVIDQLETVAGVLEMGLHGSSDNWRNIWNKENREQIYYTVFPREITETAGKVNIVIEIWESAVAHKDELWKWAESHPTASKLTRGQHGNWNFQQLLIKTIDVPAEDFEKLAEKMLEVINNELEPIRKELKEQILNFQK